MCAKGLNKRKIIKNSFYVLVGVFLLSAFCSLIGVIDIVKEDYLGNTRVVLGMGHPNVFSLFCNLIFLHLAYLFYDKITIKHLAICSVIAGILYVACQSRTGLLTYMITLIFFVVFKYTKQRKVLLISSIIVSVLALLFSLLPIIYSPYNNVMVQVNSFFTGRLSQAHYYYVNYGIKIFGQSLFEELNASYTQNILDIGYSRMYLYNGLAYYLAVIIGYVLLMKSAIKKNDRKLMLLICFFLVYMCSENPGTYIFFNISMLYFFSGTGRKRIGGGNDS